MTADRAPNRMIRCRRLRGGERAYPAADFRFRPAAYGVVIRGAEVLLGVSAFSGLLDIPGGAVHPWESLADGLMREFEEETGVRPAAVSGEPFTFAESWFAIFDHPYRSLRFYFHVTLPEGAEAQLRPQEGEVTALRWVDPAAEPDSAFAPGDRALLLRALQAKPG